MKTSAPAKVFCSPDVLLRARQQYPSSVIVSEFAVTNDSATFSTPRTQARLQRSEVERAVVDAILASKPSVPSAEPDRSAVNFSPAERAFAAEFKLPGQADVPQAKPAAKPNATAAPSTEKKPTRVGMKPATVAFINEFKLPQSK